MTPKQLARFWPNQASVAKMLGIRRQAVNNWYLRDHIPLKWQVELEHMSDGALIISQPRRHKENGS